MSRSAVRLAALVAGLIIFAAIARVVPHAPNFAPLVAVALFAAHFTGRPLVGFGVAAGAMLLSDAVIGFHEPGVMAAVYFALAAPALFGGAMAAHGVSGLWGPAAAVGSGLFFFAVTNAAVWAFAGYYPLTGAGLVESYAMALPFLKFQIAGDALYAALLFGGAALAKRTARGMRAAA